MVLTAPEFVQRLKVWLLFSLSSKICIEKNYFKFKYKGFFPLTLEMQVNESVLFLSHYIGFFFG